MALPLTTPEPVAVSPAVRERTLLLIEPLAEEEPRTRHDRLSSPLLRIFSSSRCARNA
jgi:hypothetical protein